MDQKQKLNNRQIAWMVGVIIIAGGLMSLPRALIEVSLMDAWMAHLGGCLYALIIAAFFYYLAARYPGKNLYEIILELTGRWIGGAINALLITACWMVMAAHTRVFVDFMNTTLLSRTPAEVVMYLFVITMIYYGKTSIEVVARVNDFIYPCFMLVVFSVPLMLSNELSFERAEPMLGQGVRTVFASNVLSISWYGDVFVLGAFLHTITNAKQIHASIRNGIVVAALTLSVGVFTIIAVLGSRMAGRTLYPTYTLVEQIHITDFLDRMELVVFSFWLPAFILKSVFVFLALLSGINSFTGQNDYTIYAKPVGWFVLLSTLLSFENIVEVVNFANYGMLAVTLAVEPTLMVLLFFLARKKRVDPDAMGRQGEQNESDEEGQSQRNKNMFQRWAQRVSPRRLMWTTNLLLLTCAGALTAGAFLGQRFSWLGLTCAGVYALCMLCATACSQFENSRTKQMTKYQHNHHGEREHEETNA